MARTRPSLEKDKPMAPTCEQIFQMQFVPRRNALIQALTAELGLLLEKCDPSQEPLCLYGYPDSSWDVTIEEDVPCEVPEPCCGINWQMELNIYDWITSVAMRSDAWLLRIISVLIGTYHLDRGQRGILFDKICSLDTILEEITLYYTRNDVPGIVQSIYYGQSLISIPGNTGNQRNNGEQKQRTIDQRNTGEQQHRNIGEQQHRNTREQQHKNTGDQGNNGEQQHRRIDMKIISRNTGDQRNNGEQEHERIDMINLSRNTLDQRNNGKRQRRTTGLISISGHTGDQRNNEEQPHKRSSLRNNEEYPHKRSNLRSMSEITGNQRNNEGQTHKRSNLRSMSENSGHQRNDGDQPHKTSNLRSKSENTGNQSNNGDQPHKRSNLINASRSNVDQPHKRSNLINASRSNGDQPHKRSNLTCLSGNNGDQSHERSNLICFSGNNGDQLHKRKRSSHIFYTRKEHGQKRSAKQKEENQFFQSKTSEDNCGMCKKLAKGDAFWIWCDVCERWFHGDCVGVTEEDAKSIGKFECPLCKQGQKKRHRAKETKT